MSAALAAPVSTGSLAALVDRCTALLAAAGLADAAGEAWFLARTWSGRDLAWLLGRGGEPAEAAGDPRALLGMARRRAGREPAAYIAGRREFFGRPFLVGPGVLVPRPETETLVEWALAESARAPGRRVADLCAGSGIVGITLALEAGLDPVFVEKSPDAVPWLLRNLALHGLGAPVREADLLEAPPADLLGGPFDLLVMNPPYVAAADLPGLAPEVRDFEPRLALDGGGEEGLEFFRRVLPRLAGIAAPGAVLLAELGAGHGARLPAGSVLAGWTVREWHADLAGIPRVCTLRRAGAA